MSDPRAAFDISYWYAEHRECCPHCGINLGGLHPEANLSAHFLGGCKKSTAQGEVAESVPATPAPSQPAGAREWLHLHKVELAPLSAWPLPKEPVFLRDENHYVSLPVSLTEFARQQTAAKDAALQAAERERDSLREALADVSDKVQRLKMYQPVGIAQFRRALREAIDAAEAALKSGRE